MNDNELIDAWSALEPSVSQHRRIERRLFSHLDACDTPLAAEWLGLFQVAPFATFGLAALGAVAIGVTPLVWVARVLM